MILADMVQGLVKCSCATESSTKATRMTQHHVPRLRDNQKVNEDKRQQPQRGSLKRQLVQLYILTIYLICLFLFSKF